MYHRSAGFDSTSRIAILRDFARDTRGATAIEYGLIAAAVFFGIIGPVKVIASKMNITYANILDYFNQV
jgi:Flp pilus assembly pilin Flp